MTRRRLTTALVSPAVLCACLLTACSANPPHLSRISAQLLYEKDPVADRVSEELSVFVIPEDEDGIEDLQYLHVISDEAELYWSLDSDAWTQIKSQNDEWIGSARLAAPANERIPRGEYRVMLYDLAGESDEQRFTLDAAVVAPGEVPFPQSAVTGGRITVTGSSDWYSILVYSRSDTYVRSFPVQARGVDLESVRRVDSALRGGFSYYVYTYWSRGGAGLLVGPYYVD